MPRLTFSNLVEIYRSTIFDTDGGGGLLTISNERIKGYLEAIEADQHLYDDVQISVNNVEEIRVGATVRVNIGSPKLSLGLLLRNADTLFRSPHAAIREPPHYYLIEEEYSKDDQPAPIAIERYRGLLYVIEILREAASYVDEVKHELVYLSPEKCIIPIRFGHEDLDYELVNASQRLGEIFEGSIHRKEKLELLGIAIHDISAGLRPNERFAFLIKNLNHICDEVSKGYSLFASSFSYSKIRNEIETARHDYISKIHKTISEIQGQLLGIPVATIVVTSQLRPASGCSAALWTNAAVLLGAWIFVALLFLATFNQKHTLNALHEEVQGQQSRLAKEYAAISPEFSGVFVKLLGRIRWHRRALNTVIIAAGLGAILTTVAFFYISDENPVSCLAQSFSSTSSSSQDD